MALTFRSKIKSFFANIRAKFARGKLSKIDIERAEKLILDSEAENLKEAKKIIVQKNKEIELKKRELKAEQKKNIVLRKIKARKERQVPRVVFQKPTEPKEKKRFIRKKNKYQLSITFSWFVRYVQRAGGRDDSPEAEGSSGPTTEIYKINAENDSIAREKALNILRQKHNEIGSDVLLHNNKLERIISIDAMVFNAVLSKDNVDIDELQRKFPYVQPQI